MTTYPILSIRRVRAMMATGTLMLLPGGAIFAQAFAPAAPPPQPSVYDRQFPQPPMANQPPVANPAMPGMPNWPVQRTNYEAPTGERAVAPQPGQGPAGIPANPAPNGGVPAAPVSSVTPVMIGTAQPGEHPLVPSVRWAKQVHANVVANIKDYSCTLVKRERVDGTLREHEFLFVKVRHEPFSVYTYFMGPADLKGQEAMYIAGQNDGKLWAHATGLKHRLIGTVSLQPTSTMAMAGNRYPITEMGIKRLTERLIEVGEADMKFGECDVQVLPGAKVGPRECTRVDITHPVPRREFLYHLARVYVDNELQLPIRFESYGWPQNQGEQPPLLEEYTYTNLKIDQGLTVADFDTQNPQYRFK